MTEDLRLQHIEENLSDLKQRAADREWLEALLGRMEDKILRNTDEINEVKEEDKARRRAVFTAVVGSGIALLVTLLEKVPL